MTELGSFQPFAVPLDEIDAGRSAILAGNIRSVHDTKVGDTVTLARQAHPRPTPARLQGA